METTTVKPTFLLDYLGREILIEQAKMQNTIEKGLKIHPLGTLVAVLACMVIFYVCNFIVTKFSKGHEEDLAREMKQRVEEVKLSGQGPGETDGDLQDKVEDVKATEKDIDKATKEKNQASMGMEGKPVADAVTA